MKRGSFGLTVAIGALVLCTAPAAAAPTEIEFGLSQGFLPRDVSVDFVPGENTFEWNRNDPGPDFHSVTSDGGNFGTGTANGFTEFDLRASAGTYPYHCTLHGFPGGGGMAGTVAVRPIFTGSTDDSYDIVWAGDGTATGSTFDARWKRQGQPGWKTWGSFQGDGRTFGRKDKPTEVKPNKTYLIQVRSRTPGKSKWSPALVLAPDVR